MSWNDPMQVTGVPAPHAQAYPATPPGYAEHATIPVSPTGLETAAVVTAKTATSRALEKVTNALEDLNSFLNTPDVDVAALKERTSLLRQTVAEYKEYLGSSDNAKYFQDALAALEPLLPTKNSAESKGLIPVFFPSATPSITYTDDELTFHRPERVGDFLLVDTDLGEYGHPRFHYSDGTRTARFEEIDFPSEAFPEDFRYDAERFLTYTGRYDEVWSHKPGTEYVMVVRSADGRFWQASVSGNTDGATYRGIGYTWLKAFD